MGSLGQFIQIKDAPEGFQPVLLCQFAFQDGTLLYVSTHALNVGEGGFQAPDYFGEGNGPVDYFARVLSQSLGSLQALSQQGIGRIPAVTLKLANADQDLWSNYELDPGPGFRGAFLTIRLAGWQVGTSNFTSDAKIKFVGTCDAAFLEDEATLVVQANNSHNTAAVKLPDAPVQNRCFNSFPQTPQQRLDGATNRASQFWSCGYCPDQSFLDPEGGAGPIGNIGAPNLTAPDGTQITDENGVYVSCDYTRSSGPDKTDLSIGCMARLGDYNSSVAPDGDLEHDASGRLTARFNGIQFSPGNRLSRSRSYETGAWIDILNYQNTSILGGFHNLVYGRQFVTPKAANILEDANATYSELVLGNYQSAGSKSDDVGLEKLILNGVQIPFARDNGGDFLFNWGWISLGTRSGGLTLGAPFNKQSDTYGSLSAVNIAVYRDLWDGGSSPNVQALVRSGPLVRWDGSQIVRDYQAQTDDRGQTVWHSPAWVLMDALVRANYQYSDLDLDSFLKASTFSDTLIPYRDMTGNQAQHARYMCEFALTQRTTAAEVIDSILRCFDAFLNPSDETGKLVLNIRGSLADQQPDPVTGSNDNEPVDSIHADSTPGTGYYAYRLDESTIARDEGPNGRVHISMLPAPNSSTANEIVIQFQDTANQYVQDSLTQLEPMSAARCGGTPLGGQPGSAAVPETMNIRGINNFDQAYRIANRYLWEQNYGNEIGDARGTRRFKVGVASGMRVSHLRIGHIILMAYGPLGIEQAFRVTGIEPGGNFESCSLEITWHEDEWYTDLFAQAPFPYYSNPGGDGANRPPYPWRPYAVLPNITSFRDQTAWNFAIGQQYTPQADGGRAVTVIISGAPPENVFADVKPPHTPLEASANGGSVHDTMISLLAALCAEDANGSLSRPSRFIRGRIPATGTLDVDLEDFAWPKGATGWQLFMGRDEPSMCFQAKGDGRPDVASAPFLYNASYGLPDQYFHHFKILAKPILFGGILITHVTAVDGESLTLAVPDGWNTDLTGHYLSLYALLHSENLALPASAVSNTAPEAIAALTQVLGAAANGSGQPVNSMPMRDFKISASTGATVTLTEDPTDAFAPLMQATADNWQKSLGADGIDIDQWLNIYYAVTGKPPLNGAQASAVFNAAGIALTPLSARQQFVTLSVFLAAINSVGFRAITGSGLIAMQALADAFQENTGAEGSNVFNWIFNWVQVTGRDALTPDQVESLVQALRLTDDSAPTTFITADQFSAAVIKAGFEAIGTGGFGDIGISVGDIVCVRTLTDIFGPSRIGCSTFVNAFNPDGLGSPNVLRGNVVKIIGGTGEGQERLIAEQDSTAINTLTPWTVIPDETSIFIIVPASWPFVAEKTSPITEPLPTDFVSLSVNLPNPSGQAFLVMVETATASGKASLENLSPYREIFVFGSPTLTTPQAEFTFANGQGGVPADIAIGGTTNQVILRDGQGGIWTGFDIKPETVPTGSAAIFDVIIEDLDESGNARRRLLSEIAGLPASPMVAADGVAGIQTGFATGDVVKIQGPCTLQGIVVAIGETTPGQRVQMNIYWQ